MNKFGYNLTSATRGRQAEWFTFILTTYRPSSEARHSLSFNFFSLLVTFHSRLMGRSGARKLRNLRSGAICASTPRAPPTPPPSA